MKPSLSYRAVFLGLLGAAIGGTAGFLLFDWILSQGFYALILPPALLGLSAGWFARGRSEPLAITCGIIGLGLGLFTEWSAFPFRVDESLLYFLTHIHHLKPITLLMLAVGTFLSYRLALGPDAKPSA